MLLALSATIVTCLTGCSSGFDPTATIYMEWQNGQIYYNGKPTDLTEYTGYEATVSNTYGEFYFTIDSGNVSPDTVSVNTQGVTLDNMTKYEGKYYYLEYLGSIMTMLKDLGEGYVMVCQVGVNGNEPGLMAKYASTYMDQFYLTENAYKVDFGDFTFGSDWDTIKMNSTGCSITGTCKISQDGHGCTTPYTITSDDGKKTMDVMMSAEARYDWYQIGDYTFQIAKGLNINDYIHLK